MEFAHQSVLLNECIDALAIKPDGIYLDGTLGGAGHSLQICRNLTTGRLIGVDRDLVALEAAKKRLYRHAKKVTLVHDNFENVGAILTALGLDRIDGMLFDLGVSSPQLDDAERGFSYMADAPLDMRMDREQSLTAYEIVNNWPREELKSILYEYGEERYAPQIAAAIERVRTDRPIETTLELVDIIRSAMPASALREKQHPAKRSFQAIRIAVNDELGAVRQGMEEDILPHITAAVTKFEGMDYRSITSTPTEDDKSLKVVMEGTTIPQTTVKTQENLVRLNKRGRMLVSSYEAIRFQRLDLFTVTLRQIGAYIARAHLMDAIDVIVNGDGNNNPAPEISVSATGSIKYEDLISLWTNMAPYELNTIIAPTASMQKLLMLNEMKDSSAGLNFQGTGKLITPMGANVIHTPEIEGEYIIGLDKNCALEMVKAGEVQTEYDKLIDRQLERASITSIAGFAKIYNDAGKILSYA